jgi:hypothetical protein
MTEFNAVRGLVTICLCAAAVLAAGCGGAGSKKAAQPSWVKKANAICKVDDAKIAAAERIAGPQIIFSAFTVSRLAKELDGLAKIGVPELQQSFLLAVRAHDMTITAGDPRRPDALLLRAKALAAAKGVHCSFGAVPLRKIQ